jgi:hypothetical protein
MYLAANFAISADVLPSAAFETCRAWIWTEEITMGYLRKDI